MYSYQSIIVPTLAEVSEEQLRAFTSQPVHTETVALRKNSLLFWEEHYLRLMASMRILRMKIPLNFTMEYLEEKANELIEASGANHSYALVSFNVVRETAPTLKNPLPESFLSISYQTREEGFFCKNDLLPIELYKDHFLSEGLYSSLSSVNSHFYSMAWVFAHENGYQDAFILNENKEVVETLRGSLFLVNKNHITTPPVYKGGRKGVYRNLLFSTIEKSDKFTIEEKSISPFSLQKSDEIFVLEDTLGIHSISKYRKKHFSNSQAQTIFRLLLEEFN